MAADGRTLRRVLASLTIPLVLTAALALSSRSPRRARPAASAATPAIAPGSFRVSYGPAAAGDMRAWRKRLRADHVLERTAARLNEFVRLPADVVLAFDECGEDDAYYEKGRVTFCYEEVADYADLLGRGAVLTEGETRRVEGATSFFILHEAGHALVDLLALPVTGKEEDAVDQFAVYFLAQADSTQERADAMGAAAVLGRLARAESSDSGPLPVWDVHSLDAQRQANLLCWVYGADPTVMREAVRHAGLPEERQSSCEEEYAQMAASWSSLLGPHRKATQPAPPGPEPGTRRRTTSPR